LNRRLRGTQSQSGWFGEVIKLWCLPETEPQFVGHPAQSLVTKPNMLPWPLCRNFPAIIYLFIICLNKFELWETHIFNYRKLYLLMLQEIIFTVEKNCIAIITFNYNINKCIGMV
jgi:hypothetical protein